LGPSGGRHQAGEPCLAAAVCARLGLVAPYLAVAGQDHGAWVCDRAVAQADGAEGADPARVWLVWLVWPHFVQATGAYARRG
jgi:hypothetical protein